MNQFFIEILVQLLLRFLRKANGANEDKKKEYALHAVYNVNFGTLLLYFFVPT